MLKENFKELCWGDFCERGECFGGCDHSHNFELGRDRIKNCFGCNKEMKPYIQVCGPICPGGNWKLASRYECSVCAIPYEDIWYDDVWKGWKEIYKVAKAAIASMAW